MIERSKELRIKFDNIGADGQIYGNGKNKPEIDFYIPAEIPDSFYYQSYPPTLGKLSVLIWAP